MYDFYHLSANHADSNTNAALKIIFFVLLVVLPFLTIFAGSSRAVTCRLGSPYVLKG